MNSGVTFNILYETEKSYTEKIMRLILDEIIMSDRHLVDGQMCSFLELFFNAEKNRLN